MTFWLYQPTRIVHPSSWLVYKNNDLGDFLNFLTILLISFCIYLKRKGDDIIWRKALPIGMFLILFSSLFTGSKTDTELIDGIEVPKYYDYEFSLSVD
jgi:hypothetical protein